MSRQLTREQKAEWLARNGYLGTLDDGEPAITAGGVSLLTGVSIERLKNAVPELPDGVLTTVYFPADLMRDMRRGAQGIMARIGSTDCIEVMYQQAAKEK